MTERDKKSLQDFIEMPVSMRIKYPLATLNPLPDIKRLNKVFSGQSISIIKVPIPTILGTVYDLELLKTGKVN